MSDEFRGELVEPGLSVFSWQLLFRGHGRHSFRRRNTASTGVAVGLLISTYVTYDQNRGDFAASTVSASRLAAELGLKRTSIPTYLEEGMAGGWWLVEGQGRGLARLITLATPRVAWWDLDEPATKGPDLTPRDDRGQFAKRAPAPPSGATPPAPPSGATSTVEESDEGRDLPHSAGNPTCPANGEGPARRTVDTCPTQWGTTEETYENTPTQKTNGSPIDIDDEVVVVRVDGPHRGKPISLPKRSADQLIAEGKAVAA